jgi:hypothetical protein
MVRNTKSERGEEEGKGCKSGVNRQGPKVSPVVQVREGDAVLRSDGLANDDLVDVVELVPIFVTNTEDVKQIRNKRTSRLGRAARTWDLQG